MASFDTPGGLLMAYRSLGNGPPAVFVHPPPLDGSLWLDQVRALGDIRRCVNLDLLGHGLSDPNPAPVYRPSDHARDLAALLAVAAPEGRIDIVGLGAGGLIAALAVQAAPARFASLTLISPDFGHAEPPVEQRFHQEYARMAVVEEREVVFRRLAEDLLSPQTALATKARYRSMLQRSPVESLVRALDGRSEEPRADLPGALALPILVVTGGADPRVGARDRPATSANIRTATIATSGALAPIEDPVALNRLLRGFWLEVSPPRAVGLKPAAGKGS